MWLGNTAELERLRDPTHVRALAAQELVLLLEEAGLDVGNATWVPQLSVPMHLGKWMEATGTPHQAAEEIVRQAEAELGKELRTGMAMFRDSEGDLCFEHQWAVVYGRKPACA